MSPMQVGRLGWITALGGLLGAQTMAQPPILQPGAGFEGPTAQPSAVGDPAAPGYDAKAIARWDVVPNQTVEGAFELGVVAFHRDGIDRVEFSVNNGPWSAVAQPSINPRTGVSEYWATLDAGTFEADGLAEVRAVVYPKVGVPRVLAGPMQANGEHSLNLHTNARGSLAPTRTVYVSPTGSDANPGTLTQPLQTIGQALSHVRGGDQIILAEPGDYLFGQANKHQVDQNNDRWITVRPADGISRDQVVITQQNREVIRPFTRVHWQDVSFDSRRIGQYYGGEPWFDRTRWYDSEGWVVEDNRLSPVRGDHWVTDSVAEDKLYGFTHASLVRGAEMRNISGDVFQNSRFVVNSKATNVDGTVLEHHTDLYQMWGEMDNLIVYGITAENLTATQSIFLEPTYQSPDGSPQYKLTNAAFIDIKAINELVARGDEENWGGPPYSQLISQFEHVLFENLELPNQRLIFRADLNGNQAFSAEDVIVKDSVLHWATWRDYAGPDGQPPEGVIFLNVHVPEPTSLGLLGLGGLALGARRRRS